MIKVRVIGAGAALFMAIACLTGCASTNKSGSIAELASTNFSGSHTTHGALRLVISIHDQKMALIDGTIVINSFLISTSREGAGEEIDSGKTPRGIHAIAETIGAGAAIGTVFVDRLPTNEVVAVNTVGRSPIATRILRLKGLQAQNWATFDRLIYLHGSPAESTLGTPQSGGCIRMSSTDIIQLFEKVGVGTVVAIFEEPLHTALKLLADADRYLLSLEDNAAAGALDSIRKLCVGGVWGLEGFSKNDASAKRWCFMGAKRRDPTMIAMVGELYESGRGVSTSYEDARLAFEIAADLGNAHALFKVAKMYREGIGGSKNETLAKKYLERLAGQGHSGAKKMLGGGQ